MALLTVPQSSISGEPGARFSSDGASGLAGVQGDQTRELGQTLQGAGQTAAKIITDMQLEANQLRVDDAVNRLKEEQLRLTFDPDGGFSSQRGIAALEREGGRSLADEFTGKLDTTVSDLSASLGNVPQREAFARAAAGLRTEFYGQLTQHETREYTAYSVSVRDGTVGLRLNEMGTRWNDPTFNREEATLSIRAAVADKGRILGWSAVEVETRATALVSAGHKTAILAALEDGNVGFADGYLQRYSKDMTADDLLGVRGRITKEMDATVALAAVEDVYTGVTPALAPTDADRAFNITVGAESGGKQFGPDGRPLTSSAGAVGVAQVMEGTGPEAARLAGERWDRQRWLTDRAYNLKIGKAYFDHQLRTFGGDVRKAWAAYNAGPGWVKAAQARAAVAAPGTLQADWFWQLNNDGRTAANRQETQNYVEANARAYGTGLGAPPKPTLDDIIKGLRSDPRLAGNPDRLRIATDEATRRWQLAEGERKQRRSEALDTAFQLLTANGGNYTTLPSSVRAALDPTDIPTVMNYAATLAKGQDPETDLALYQRLSDPAVLKSMSESEFLALRPFLSANDFKQFAAERGKPTGGAAKDPGAIDSPGINRVLADRLRTLGIDPSPDATKKKGEAARVGAMTRFIRDSVIMTQQRLGRPLTDAELVAHIDGLFAKSFTFQQQGGLFGNGQDITTPMMTMDIGDIPAASAREIRDAFKRRGVDKPTDWEIVGAYWRMRGGKAR